MSARFAENRRDDLRSRRQHRRIGRGELHLDRLAGRGAGARRGHLDENAGDVGSLVADRIHDDVGGRPRPPVGELELDDADGVFGKLAHAARLSPMRA